MSIFRTNSSTIVFDGTFKGISQALLSKHGRCWSLILIEYVHGIIRIRSFSSRLCPTRTHSSYLSWNALGCVFLPRLNVNMRARELGVVNRNYLSLKRVPLHLLLSLTSEGVSK